MDEKQKRERKWRRTQNLTFLFPLLLSIILLVVVMVPFIPAYRSISLADAAGVLEELGYSPYDSTDTLCAYWIDTPQPISSVSANSDGLKLDLYQCDNSYPLAILEGFLETYMSRRIPRYPYEGYNDSRNYEVRLYKSDGCAVMRITLEDTVLFIEWDPDCEDRVLEILDALGYPGEKAMKDLRKVIWR